MVKKLLCLFFAVGFVLAQSTVGFAEEASVAAQALFTLINTLMLLATFLVFILHLGFLLLDAGLSQSKNTTNILFKNTVIISI